MVDPQIKDQWRQSIHYALESATPSVNAQTTFETPIFLEASVKVERARSRVVFNTNGVRVEISHTLLTDVDIPEGSMVWLDGADESDESEGLIVNYNAPFEDEYGAIDHYELGLGGPR